jgi:hypothetical protein
LSVALSIPCFGAKYGGQWVKIESAGYSTTMELSLPSAISQGIGGTIYLSANYYTYFDSLVAGDSIYTRGIGRTGYYDFRWDTTGSDTNALNLGGFIGQYVQINAYFLWSAKDTLFAVIEQALSMRPPASDTAIAHGLGISERFNEGFKTTDTLFYDSLRTAKDAFYVSATGTGDSCVSWRMWTDHFEVVAPIVRIKLYNKGLVTRNNRPIGFEIYVRNRNEVLGGASGRLLDRWEPKQSQYGSGTKR